MFDLIAWLLDINTKANLREQLDEANKRIAQASKRTAKLPLEKRMATIEAENQELKLRLGVIIRLLTEKGLLDAQQIVEAFERFKVRPSIKAQPK